MNNLTPQQKHKAFKSHLLELQTTKFNSMSVLEPVGTTVLLLMKNHEILKASRKDILESRGKQGVYYRDGVEITGEIIGWSYC